MTLKGRQDESIRQDLADRFDPCYVAQNWTGSSEAEQTAVNR